MLTKEQIREKVKRRRLLLPESERKRKSEQIVEKLKALLPSDVNTLMFYAPFKGEVDLLPLAEWCLSRGKRVVFPRVSGKEILPLEVFSLSELSPGYCSILEPPYELSRAINEIDVVFVPGIAFDLNCFRIGYGGGFYDRFLARTQIGFKIGICFDFQVVERIPHDPYDVPVDLVVTEKREIRRKEWS
ncbi:5-formyltetrahydrofolate cyclo-ligase [Phorcysia thermohydrogeniphila]|uniref:5-formyltetrahydrofolate cyclo-ligase n=1 Tax=Phorcysia thermohydrogeniphila TaxID=936138 RepID=A0A4R1GIF2_9BACT|nr:5-formyltetrahydrofolate cyclo-ligase [Phorcysia thermohydrogeniphila]TCK06715.1 5-formyltetrahydrofolate cyclo-ligase [Phorcysia thermohydrogeniphila]